MMYDTESLELRASQTKHRRLAIETPYINRMQRRHFFTFSIVPLIGTLAALGLAAFFPVGRVALASFAAMFFVTGLGMSVGYHRLFTHGSFETTTPVRVGLAIAASMAAQGPAISWVAIHRRHHQFADKHGDMHSPNMHGASLAGRIRGFFHAHYSWMIKHEYPNIVHYAPDLLADRAILRTSRLYYWWIALGVAIPAVVGGVATGSWFGALMGLMWGGFVRLFVVAQLIATLNSLLHIVGSRPYRLRDVHDKSRNNWVLGLLVWGEGWHHNHHAFPYSAWFGLAWYRFDMSYAFIVLLKSVGLAWNVKVPTDAQLSAKVAQPTMALAE